MNKNLTNMGELIYRAEIRFTGMVEYGVSMEALTSGQLEIPQAGARFDQTFQGVLQGPKVKGIIEGTDYLYVRPDWSFQLHLHGRIITEDGINITLSSEGISHQIEGKTETQIRSAVRLFTASEQYIWLNKLQLWAVGSLDTTKGEAVIRAYSV